MKKLFIILCLILLPALCNPAFCEDRFCSNNIQLVKDVEFDGPKDIIKCVSDMEYKIDGIISNDKDKKRFAELFELYMQNLNVLSFDFYSLYRNTEYYADEYGSKVDVKYDGEYGDEYDTSFHYSNPKVNTVYIKREGDYLYFNIDYAYLDEHYSKYLNRAWKTYIRYRKNEYQESRDISAYFVDGEENTKYNKLHQKYNEKWLRNWTIFTKLNPDFPLNKEIKKDMVNIEYSGVEFNLNNYILLEAFKILGIIVILGILIAIVKKVQFGDKIKTFNNNVSEKIKPLYAKLKEKTVETCKSNCGFILNYKKYILIGFGVIAAIAIIGSVHNKVAVPKCDSQFAEQEVIEIYKNNSSEYELNAENVDRVTIDSFTPESYDKEVGKYTCSAVLTVYAKEGKSIVYAYPFKKFRYDVKYEIYKERGKNSAKASWKLQNLWQTNQE